MPRRQRPEALALQVGERIRQLRTEAGLTIEKLAYESAVGSKGHISNLERGLVRPTINTLAALAERLGVHLLDLVTFPDEDDRQRLVDMTRTMTAGTVKKLVAESTGKRSPPRRSRKAR